jgi:diguanylate cyclase (GGDEF)-like protein
LEQEVKMMHRSRQSVSLLYVDLDRFKEVNDTMGHDVGDDLLKHAADRIRQCVRETDTVARIGGDEFTIIVPQIDDPIVTGKIAQNVIDKLELPFILRGVELSLSASIGVASCPKDGETPEQLIKSADLAMYEAKKAGRGCFRYCGIS